MIFTDGQLLTATDINNFLLNRETNPELDKAKTQALQHIEELKTSIPKGGKPLDELPEYYFNSEAVVMQAWSLKYTRNKEEVRYKDNDWIEIQAEDSILFPKYFLTYDHKTMTIDTFSSWEENMGKNLIEHDGWPHKPVYKPSSYIHAPQEIRFITFSSKKTKLKIDYNISYLDNTSLEEVPDDLTKLLAAQR
ncbi:hypothetical protein F4555_001337 [Mobiluncus mulieris]|uniref:Uncharacterized protein n=1 Tax=Mobiluncus mulieris TaxID=2052 RepID=A0A8G2HWS1_9ACTO|nr:hypothetical protein [Mobiluncus mulieris]MBB5846541.1 hypothetical protein [Mobiluncus mulieris]MCV0011702.1 hypothetical protein [Mobiluncus mulieris]STO16983.1 Uncharacterised protein [Mobiluncus mulieris]